MRAFLCAIGLHRWSKWILMRSGMLGRSCWFCGDHRQKRIKTK